MTLLTAHVDQALSKSILCVSVGNAVEAEASTPTGRTLVQPHPLRARQVRLYVFSKSVFLSFSVGTAGKH